MNLQLGNCPILAVWLRPTTYNKQHANQIHAACYKVVGLSPSYSQYFFFIFVFYLGIADGAKVGLKQLMLTYGTLKDSTVSVTGTYPIKHHFIEFYTEQWWIEAAGSGDNDGSLPPRVFKSSNGTWLSSLRDEILDFLENSINTCWILCYDNYCCLQSHYGSWLSTSARGPFLKQISLQREIRWRSQKYVMGW